MKFRCNKCGAEFEARLVARCPSCGESMDVQPVYASKLAKP